MYCGTMELPERKFKTRVKHGSKSYTPSYCTAHGKLNTQLVIKNIFGGNTAQKTKKADKIPSCKLNQAKHHRQ